MHNLGCTYINGCMWAHMWFQCNIHYVLTIIFIELMCGLTCMFELFINVCCASNFEMMIQVNGVFELLKVNTSMEPNDCMNICWFGIVGACTSKGGAWSTWIKLSSIGMFIFTLLLSDSWTCQTIELNNNLENKMFCHQGIQRHHVGLHPYLTFVQWQTFICTFIKIGHWIFRQYIFFIPCHGVGARSILQKLVINVYVHQDFHPIQHQLISHFAMDKWVRIPIPLAQWYGTHLYQNTMGNGCKCAFTICNQIPPLMWNKLSSFIKGVSKKGLWFLIKFVKFLKTWA